MTINEWQKAVDNWIKLYGVRYFDISTNTLLLAEEFGEYARLIARKYGEQSFKNTEDAACVDANIKEEMADMIFVISCMANQQGIDLTEILKANLDKKTKRDHERHSNNPKL
jgi:NTP pyrophosphatase (non-canonical NTP hydrolase)